MQRLFVRGPLRGDKVIIAMSGGVDSSVTAALLARQDKFDLEGVFMRNWDAADDESLGGGCQWKKDWEDVQSVCKTLGIRARMVDLSKEYWTRVFEPSLRAWEKGWTPNPDVWCNKEVKFGALLDRLTPAPAGDPLPWLATGHYARKDYHPPLKGKDENAVPLPRLLRHPSSKDQSYYLASIPLPSLRRTIFPLGNPPICSLSPSSPTSSPSPLPSFLSEGEEHGEALTKPQVLTLAHRYGLKTALNREESMGICFVGERRRFGEFVSQYISPTTGPIIHLPTQTKIGEHQGVWNYTIGQGAKVGGCSEKMFVVRKRVGVNGSEVWVAPGNHPSLYIRSLTCAHFTWIWPSPPPDILSPCPSPSPTSQEAGSGIPKGMKVRVRIRYIGTDEGAWVYASSSTPTPGADPNAEVEAPSEPGASATPITITFETPQKAVSPGQIAVIYDERGEWCLGCGVICDTVSLE